MSLPSGSGRVKNQTSLRRTIQAGEGEFCVRPRLRSCCKMLAPSRRPPDCRATELGLRSPNATKKFSTLISTEAVPELKQIKVIAADWHVGAAVTLTTIEDKLGKEFPRCSAICCACSGRGRSAIAPRWRQYRHRFAHRRQRAVFAGAGGESGFGLGGRERTLPISEFSSSRIARRRCNPAKCSRPSSFHAAFLLLDSRARRRGSRLSKRREMDISTVAGAFVVDVDEQKYHPPRPAELWWCAAMPSRAKQTKPRCWASRSVGDASKRASDSPDGIRADLDVRGTAEYRSGLIVSLLEKFFAGDAERGIRVASPLNLPTARRLRPERFRTKARTNMSPAKDVCG